MYSKWKHDYDNSSIKWVAVVALCKSSIVLFTFKSHQIPNSWLFLAFLPRTVKMIGREGPNLWSSCCSQSINNTDVITITTLAATTVLDRFKWGPFSLWHGFQFHNIGLPSFNMYGSFDLPLLLLYSTTHIERTWFT